VVRRLRVEVLRRAVVIGFIERGVNRGFGVIEAL
jgi:hypothetical protein